MRLRAPNSAARQLCLLITSSATSDCTSALAPPEFPVDRSTVHDAAVPAPTPRSSLRLDYIDGLRGLAILWVLAIHVWNRVGCIGDAWWNPVSIGYIGVDLFLILSGFCLYWPMVRPRGREPTLKEFFKRRARRILPPYYVALAVCAAGSALLPYIGHTWPEAPAGGLRGAIESLGWHAAMLHNLRPGQISTFDGPFWSLALEWDLYIAMPLLVVLARKRGILTALGVAAAVSLTYRVLLDRFIGGTQSWTLVGIDPSFTLCYSLAGKWIEFALGMCAASFAAAGVPARSRWPLGWLAGALLVASSLWIHTAGALHPATELLVGAGFFCLLLRGAREDRTGLSIARLLRWKPLIRLGLISYSVYLVHLPLLNFAFRSDLLTKQAVGPRIIICLGVVLPLILGIAYLFYLAFERPFLNSRTGPATAPIVGQIRPRLRARLGPLSRMIPTRNWRANAATVRPQEG